MQSQFEQLDNTLEGSMRGIYSMMYTYSAHDVFGQRSIDMYGDILCSDMALTDRRYGWFYTEETQKTVIQRSGYSWSYYYDILHNVNATIKIIKEQTSLIDTIAKYGLPTNDLEVVDAEGTVIYTYDEEEAAVAGIYAQALTMRGYVYEGLSRQFMPTTSHIFAMDKDLTNYLCFPIYNEDNMNEGARPMAIPTEVFAQIDHDLSNAIDLFKAFESTLRRSSKLEADINVARGLLAYSNLNRAYLSSQYATSGPLVVNPMSSALVYAIDVINEGGYTILPADEVLTNGFNDVNCNSWIWGEDVTTETATGLGSFWGQVDIHCYSYAWSGGGKVIDNNLYKSIPDWDNRKNWFYQGNNSAYKLCPDKKFFSVINPTSTSQNDIDREWCNDNVFMRIELMYLIAAEASYFLGNMGDAVNYLTAITDNRVADTPEAAAAYATFKATLSDPKVFMQELIRNWRVEMWGEGKGLQTFRRLTSVYYKNSETADKVKRGDNHDSKASTDVQYTTDLETTYTFQIPGSESNYNPYLQD